MRSVLQWGVGLWLIGATACLAQDQSTPVAPPSATADPASAQDAASPSKPAADPLATPEDKRIFGVLPNNRTIDGAIPFAPISAKRKITIAYRDSFDWPVYPTAAAFASLYQLENQNPSFGQGVAGYAKRLAASYGDQMIGNMMTEGFIPALGHQDPRYFRLGEGTKWHRTGYALSRIFVARMDSGKNTFNFSEWGGNSIAVAISNAYYPDTRNVSDNVSKLMIQCATDAFSNVLKEFWPDVKRYFQRRHEKAETERK
jgi:hypothetical protein